MRFFYITFFVLGFIGLLNLFNAVIDIQLLPQVYMCSEVTKEDPINVQKRCHKWDTKSITRIQN